MRVIYVVSLFPCWSETFIVREIHALIERGIDVRIVSLKWASEAMVQDDAQALLDRCIYPRRGLRGWMGSLAALLQQPARSLAELALIISHFWKQPQVLAKNLVVWWRMLDLCALVDAQAPQRLHAHWATYPSTAAMFMAARLGLPYGLTCHAHDIFLEDHFIERKLATARVAVTISEFNREFLRRRFPGAPVDRLKIVHCGVSPSLYEFRSEGRERRLVLAVGRLDPIKGFKHLVAACAVLKQRGVPFDCRIVGEGPLGEELKAQIERSGLSGQVQMLGALKQEQVRRLLHAARVFVLPSVVTERGDRDGIPVALMEAMACGTPVLSTCVSGIPELVLHGVNGLLVEPGHAEQLADALQELLADDALTLRLSVSARAAVERDFDIGIEAGKLAAAWA